MARARVFGARCSDSFASFDPDISSWKTSQLSFDEEWAEFSETWPRSGTTRSGTACELRTLGRRISEIAFGSWPTPDASVANFGEKPDTFLARREELKKRGYNGNGAGIPLAVAVQMVPTPTVGDSKATRNKTAQRSDPNSNHNDGTTLTDFVTMFPTPAAADGERGSETYMRGNPTLLGKARNLPTPKASDHRIGMEERYGPGKRRSNLNDASGGKLNPTWVEWLMGFPLGWTALAPSEMPLSRKSRSGSAAD